MLKYKQFFWHAVCLHDSSEVNTMTDLIPEELIEKRILLLRGHKVMLDSTLAGLYGVSTKVLNQAVRRNLDRFPNDFMFVLSWEEIDELRSRSQIVTLKKGQNVKYLPMVFTEQGVAMLSSVRPNGASDFDQV